MIATVAGVALGGPIGGVVGAVVGSVAGGYAGKAVGENMNPTLEDEHWREHHDPESFGGEPYDHYAAAYRSGYEGYGRHGDSRSNFDEAEADIREEYERSGSTIPWDKARGASNAAWDKAAAQKQPGTPMTHPKPGERL
jgi:uncharacterized protein YcfJ